MSDDQSKLIRKIEPWKIIIPIILGISVVAWLFYDEFDPSVFSKISFSFSVLFFIAIAFLMIVVRDVGYMIRIKVLLGNRFSWRSAFNINFLWEFTSAITPSAVWGTTFAVMVPK